jgi:putative transposase
MSDARYRCNAGSVFSLKDFFVGCPQDRRQVRVGEIAEALRSLLYEQAQELDLTMEALEIMPDHVPLLIQSEPAEAPQPLANPFKGYTSRMLRLKDPALRSRLPSMWSRRYCVGTIDQVSEQTVPRYLEMQKSS